MKTTQDVDVEDVLMARERIRRVLSPTPLVFSERRGAYLKLEILQLTGAYKVRGAVNALAVQIERGDRRPVIAASAGNHAKGVAWAARHFGLEACVVVPEHASRTKVRGAAELGARVVTRGATLEDAFDHALELAALHDWRFVHAFDDPDVVAGQGTTALELLDARPDVVAIPIGGGGLAAGMGRVLKWHGIRAVGVRVEGPNTLADGVRVRAMSERTRRICTEALETTVTVSEDDVRRTMLDLVQSDRIVAEGAGAVAPAALSKIEGRKKIAIVSGGNVDSDLLFGLTP
jgi:threonine dehydratase